MTRSYLNILDQFFELPKKVKIVNTMILINKNIERFLDQFSCTSRENSDVDNFCPHDGHFPL